MSDLIHTINDIQIKSYSNGSYAYLNSNNRWVNIPSELAKKIITLFNFKR